MNTKYVRHNQRLKRKPKKPVPTSAPEPRGLSDSSNVTLIIVLVVIAILVAGIIIVGSSYSGQGYKPWGG